MIVGLRALEVEVLDSSGKHLATHPRAYGQASTNSEDPSMQLALLCNKPAPWPNSRVRDALPDPLREWLVLLQCLFDRFGSVFPQCGLMVFPGVVIVSR